MQKTVYSHGKPLKKQFGQHFLRDHNITQVIVDAVDLDTTSSVFEIGGGDGFLTNTILTKPIARLWVFEIDEHWVDVLQMSIPDDRLTVHYENFLDIDFSVFDEHKPWTLLANLPYQVTFPILLKLKEHRNILKEAVIMVQEEVAQKIMKTHGRGYGFSSLFYQWFFELKMLNKIPPTVFFPPPKVYSRLLYLKPKQNLPEIPHEQEFWKFIKLCFSQPRRTMKNNLMQTHLPVERISEDTLALRAQQMSMQQFLDLWNQLN